jgi:hypothetical protein
MARALPAFPSPLRGFSVTRGLNVARGSWYFPRLNNERGNEMMSETGNETKELNRAPGTRPAFATAH